MERLDVVVLEVDLDEGLPVVVASLISTWSSTWSEKSRRLLRATPARSRWTSRWPSNRRPCQFVSGDRRRWRHGLSAKCGAPRSSPLGRMSSGGWGRRCGSVAATLQHDRLPMAADVRDELEPRRACAAGPGLRPPGAARGSRRPPGRRASGRCSAGCARTGASSSRSNSCRVEVAAERATASDCAGASACEGVTRRSDMAWGSLLECVGRTRTRRCAGGCRHCRPKGRGL